MNDYLITKLEEMNKGELLDLMEEIKRRIKSETHYITHGGANAKVVKNCNSFQSKDLLAFMPDVIEIVTLQSTVKGDGATLLKKITEMFKDYPIVLKAEPMFKTKEGYAACKDLGERTASLVKYYEKQGFVDINEWTQYENAVSMLYSKDTSATVMQLLIDKGYLTLR